MRSTARVRLGPSIDNFEAGWSAFARQMEDRWRGPRLSMNLGPERASTMECDISEDTHSAPSNEHE
jgi:hypothetical protein